MIRTVRMLALAAGVATGLTAASTAPAVADGFPHGDLRVIVPAAPGGGADRTTRGQAPYFEAAGGVPVIVENVPGGNMAVGLQHYLNNEPRDGSVIVRGLQLHFSGGIARGAAYAVDDFAVIGGDMPITNSLWVHADSPWHTIDELIADIRANPGRISGNYLVGTATHIGLEVFVDLLELDVVKVPYTSGASQRADLLGRHVDFSITSLESTQAVLTEAEGRPLLVYSDERHAGAPDVPTLAEVARAHNPQAEVPSVGQQYFYAVHREVREQHPAVYDALVATMAEAVTNEEYVAWAMEQGWFIEYLDPDQATSVVERLHAVSEQFTEVLSDM